MKAIALMSQAEGNDLYMLLGLSHAASTLAGRMGPKWHRDDAQSVKTAAQVKLHNLYSETLAAGYVNTDGLLTDTGLKAMWALEGCDENGNPV